METEEEFASASKSQNKSTSRKESEIYDNV